MELTTKLGIAKLDITPKEPIPLAGFADRKGNFEGISRPLSMRVWLFEQEQANMPDKRRVLLVQADIICWPQERIALIKEAIRKKHGIEEDSIILHATHTHGGPQTTSAYYLPIVGQYHQSFTNLLEDSMFKGIDTALLRLEPVKMERGRGKSFINIYRRRLVDGRMMNAPNPDVPVDHEVTVIRFKTGQNATKGLFFHFTCHPTVTGDNRISPDYAGAAAEKIEELLDGDTYPTFLQGCSGDVRPALVRDNHFYRGSNEDVSRLGGQLGEEVVRVINSPMEELSFAPFETRSLTVDLPFQKLPTREELREFAKHEGQMEQWGQQLLEHPERLQPTIPLSMSIVRFGENLSFLNMAGEMVFRYGNFIKEQSRGSVLPLAYTNGMIGYVPTAVQVDEGGYESKDSYPYFVLPAPFDQSLEGIVIDGISDLLASK